MTRYVIVGKLLARILKHSGHYALPLNIPQMSKVIFRQCSAKENHFSCPAWADYIRRQKFFLPSSICSVQPSGERQSAWFVIFNFLQDIQVSSHPPTQNPRATIYLASYHHTRPFALSLTTTLFSQEFNTRDILNGRDLPFLPLSQGSFSR